ncbi:MAG: T9SS type A sorting domain-containing protein [Bacteroidia bacterium]|nr:T9SS type A sorting domain-containing protein [Bacteroidia bacterium]
MRLLSIFSMFMLCTAVYAQNNTKRVLFLGNSYTEVNNLPQMFTQVALSTGDTIITDKNTPGGYTLMGHSTNVSSLTKIQAGNWDYMVLQEQSQLPSFGIEQVKNEVFPFAFALDSIFNSYNPCGETVFYMTWGRKNGDASNCPYFPVLCTYEGMDSMLNLRYRMMADSNNAILSPVGAVWNYIRKNHPEIELYQADESHPSVAGTYAAACTFYAALLKKDPTLITFSAYLQNNVANKIKDAAKLVVFDSLLKWHIGEYIPKAKFSFNFSETKKIEFSNQSTNATSYLWSFGDGDTSTLYQPNHTYASSGKYTVRLIAQKCNQYDTTYQEVQISSVGVNEHSSINKINVFPNPAKNTLTVSTNNNLQIKIYNALGSLVLTQSIDKGENTIDISRLPLGLYFLYTDKGNYTKFVKK